MADPLDLDVLEEIELSTGCDLEPVIAPVNEIGAAIQRYYRGIITKMIPRRRPLFGQLDGDTPGLKRPAQDAIEAATQPTHQVADEARVELKLEVLIELLTEAGIIDREVWNETLRRRLRGDPDE
jgi:hypothetical protein